MFGLSQGVQIFDFSERKVSNRAAVLVDADELGGAPQQQVLVTRVGDALQEPFWPEGLGINRGIQQPLHEGLHEQPILRPIVRHYLDSCTCRSETLVQLCPVLRPAV